MRTPLYAFDKRIVTTNLHRPPEWDTQLHAMCRIDQRLRTAHLSDYAFVNDQHAGRLGQQPIVEFCEHQATRCAFTNQAARRTKLPNVGDAY